MSQNNKIKLDYDIKGWTIEQSIYEKSKNGSIFFSVCTLTCW